MKVKLTYLLLVAAVALFSCKAADEQPNPENPTDNVLGIAEHQNSFNLIIVDKGGNDLLGNGQIKGSDILITYIPDGQRPSYSQKCYDLKGDEKFPKAKMLSFTTQLPNVKPADYPRQYTAQMRLTYGNEVSDDIKVTLNLREANIGTPNKQMIYEIGKIEVNNTCIFDKESSVHDLQYAALSGDASLCGYVKVLK